MDSDGSAEQRGTYQIKASTGGLIKPKTHLVNQVVSDVEHPLKTHSCAQGERTCAQPSSPLSSHPPRLAQPTGISKKNRLARHDAAPGSETQPTPAGSKSGRDEGKRENVREEKKKKKERRGLALHTYRRVERSPKSAARPHFISQLTGKWLLNTKTQCKLYSTVVASNTNTADMNRADRAWAADYSIVSNKTRAKCTTGIQRNVERSGSRFI